MKALTLAHERLRIRTSEDTHITTPLAIIILKKPQQYNDQQNKQHINQNPFLQRQIHDMCSFLLPYTEYSPIACYSDLPIKVHVDPNMDNLQDKVHTKYSETYYQYMLD